MPKYICTTCGIQYPERAEPPKLCTICTEERQYVNPNGQEWTTLKEMQDSGQYQNRIAETEKNVYSIKTIPSFGIGQTAYLVKKKGFHILWDCITYLDEWTIETINELGGIDAIALSHPHYYSTQAAWAKAFNAQIYIHEDDREWVVEPSSRMIFWSGEQLRVADGLTLHRLGGHFKGGAVLHWPGGNEEKGILFSGDIVQVVADTNWVSFMYSYPNLIPLPAAKVKEIADRVEPLHFDRLYNAFDRVVKQNAKEAVRRSAERYVRALEGKLFQT